MTDTLFNDNQRRHVATHLNLLAADLAQVKEYEIVRGPLRESFAAVDAALQRTLRELSVAPARESDPTHRVRVVAEVWAMRLHDLHAVALRGYGAVHPDLAARLDPLIDEIQLRLRELADASTALAPEP